MRTKGPRADKVAVVTSLTDVFSGSSGAILTDYRGMTVSEISDLRKKLRPSGGEYHVVKNTLFKRAAGDSLSPELEGLLAGPTAIAFAKDDVVGVAKALLDFLRVLRKDEVKVKGGLVDGRIYSPDQVTALSKVPPKEVVQAQLVGTLQAPLSNFAGTMNGVLSEFAKTLQALADKRQAEAG